MMEQREKIEGRISGFLMVYECRNGGEPVLVLDGRNSITDYSETIIKGLLARNPEDFMIDGIAIGLGGDAEISEPHNDTGARVAPDPVEETMRIPLETILIQMTQEVSGGIEFTALARPDQAISDNINEFGLVARNGKIFAHYVPDADPTRAEKKPKTDIYWIMKWTVEYANA